MTDVPPAGAPTPVEAPSLMKRVAGFGGLPLISMVTPLLVLPVFARAAGQSGWASAVTGESLGALAGMVVSYGWHTVGPARIALERDARQRATYYRESLVVRVFLALCVTPALAVACSVLANPGYAWLTFLMALATALVPLSFSWFAVGAGTPGAIATLDATPRVAAAAVATGVIAATGWLYAYPLFAIVVPLLAMSVYSRRVIRADPGRWPRLGDLPRLLKRDRAAAVNDVATGAYATLPVPLVNAFTDAAVASSYASADKLLRFGQFVPGTFAHAFQTWTVEAGPEQVAPRLRTAIWAHAGVGVVGLAVLGLLGPWASGVLFGAAVAATHSVSLLLGLAFLFFSTRTAVTRLVLFPAGRARTVLRSTVAGGMAGVPAVVLFTALVGPWGAAAALLISEVVTGAMLVAPTRAVLHAHEGAAAQTTTGRDDVRTPGAG